MSRSNGSSSAPELIDITLIVPNRYQPRKQADPQAVIEAGGQHRTGRVVAAADGAQGKRTRKRTGGRTE